MDRKESNIIKLPLPSIIKCQIKGTKNIGGQGMESLVRPGCSGNPAWRRWPLVRQMGVGRFPLQRHWRE